MGCSDAPPRGSVREVRANACEMRGSVYPHRASGAPRFTEALPGDEVSTQRKAAARARCKSKSHRGIAAQRHAGRPRQQLPALPWVRGGVAPGKHLQPELPVRPAWISRTHRRRGGADSAVAEVAPKSMWSVSGREAPRFVRITATVEFPGASRAASTRAPLREQAERRARPRGGRRAQRPASRRCSPTRPYRRRRMRRRESSIARVPRRRW